MSDLIDRQALLKQIDIDSDGEPGYYGDTWKFIDTIKNMPNVHDLPKDTDTISRQAAIEAINKALDRQTLLNRFVRKVAIDAIKQLPPAQPKRGRWIYKNDLMTAPTGYWECSECKEGRLLYEENFCPHCGADMRER